MSKTGMINWFTRIAALGTGAVMFQGQGCAVDQAMVEDLTNVAVQAFVTSMVGGVL